MGCKAPILPGISKSIESQKLSPAKQSYISSVFFPQGSHPCSHILKLERIEGPNQDEAPLSWMKNAADISQQEFLLNSSTYPNQAGPVQLCRSCTAQGGHIKGVPTIEKLF